MEQVENDRMVSVREAASILEISEKTLLNLIFRERISGAKQDINGRWLIPYSEVLKYKNKKDEEPRPLVVMTTSLAGCLVVIVLALVLLSGQYFSRTEGKPLLPILLYLSGFIVDSIVAVLVISLLFIVINTPIGIRKVFAILVLISSSILTLDRINFHWGWGWNFPDIFGVVTGVLTLGYLFFDRYLKSGVDSRVQGS